MIWEHFQKKNKRPSDTRRLPSDVLSLPNAQINFNVEIYFACNKFKPHILRFSDCSFDSNAAEWRVCVCVGLSVGRGVCCAPSAVSALYYIATNIRQTVISNHSKINRIESLLLHSLFDRSFRFFLTSAPNRLITMWGWCGWICSRIIV